MLKTKEQIKKWLNKYRINRRLRRKEMNRKQNVTVKRVGLRLPTRRQKRLLRKIGWMGDLNAFTRQEASWAIREALGNKEKGCGKI